MCSGLRSEEMELCEMYLKNEAAYTCICELGELGIVHFVDLNKDINAFHRTFTSGVIMCEDMEMKLRLIAREIRLSHIKFADVCEDLKAAPSLQILDLEAAVNNTVIEMEELNSNLHALKNIFAELCEFKHVIETLDMYLKTQDLDTKTLFKDDAEPLLTSSLESIPLEELPSRTWSVKLNLEAGTIRREKIVAFELLIWRFYHRNVFVHFRHIDTPFHEPENNLVFKSVFLLMFQGETLKEKLRKICEGFGANVYSHPDTSEECKLLLKNIERQLRDMDTVLQKTSEHYHFVLASAAENLKEWYSEVLKTKSIYHTLNMCKLDDSSKNLIVRCWIPKRDVDKLHCVLKEMAYKTGIAVPVLTNINTEEEPPTYHCVNKYTKVFQLLVDSYGVSSYRELNPMPYAIVTFPFFFAVMFGDVGHGFILFLLGACLCTVRGDSHYFHGELGAMLYTGRYIIFLMGMFSMYTGLLYNECFGMTLVMFSSSWSVSDIQINASDNSYWQLDPQKDFRGYPYVFGVDPAWKFGLNGINFMNSLKMKLSIILGVLHMIFGICLSCSNFMCFRLHTGILSHFTPRLLFISLLFLYMVFLIVFKWLRYGPGREADSIHCAPSILNTMILMALMQKPVSSECNPYMFSYQYEVQTCLLAMTVICIPWMWFYGVFRCKICPSGLRDVEVAMEQTPLVGVSESAQQKVPDSFKDLVHGEGFVHRSIHTIEFILSSVSHTASYLRLWALSLAHTQLSEVLWEMVLRHGLLSKFPLGILPLFVAFTFWAMLTFAILVVMEGLSAFLHTLRLHWVEFQSKFYHGLGSPFKPFSFSAIAREAEQSIDRN